jgi:hypothetical protein
MSDETQLEYMEKRRKKLEEGNNRSYNELRQKLGPQFVMDTGDLRREMFYTHLIKWGIITEQQALEFEIAFHEKVDSALEEQWAAFREMEKGRNLSVVRKPDRLVDQHGRPLT